MLPPEGAAARLGGAPAPVTTGAGGCVLGPQATSVAGSSKVASIKPTRGGIMARVYVTAVPANNRRRSALVAGRRAARQSLHQRHEQHGAQILGDELTVDA